VTYGHRPSGFKLAWDVLLELGDRKEGPLHHRLTEAIRDAIQSGRLPTGAALPPTRVLAQEFGCSRWVVSEAYAQLVAEGYVATRVGSGTRVQPISGRLVAPQAPPPATSAFDRDVAPVLVDLSSFPIREWTSSLRAGVSILSSDDLEFPPGAGHIHLREVLAEYLHRVRGVNADRENVTITTGTDDGLSRLFRAMRAHGIETVALEDPGWRGVRRAAEAAGLETVTVSVDSDGLCVRELAQNDRVRAVIVTPAHQFPTGAVLSAQRREQLLAWAGRVDGLIVEDDADADRRYEGRLVGAVQSADPLRVAYVASACRNMSPAFGMGWMVTPAVWTRLIRSLSPVTPCPSVLDQLAFAILLQHGGYERHLRRSRKKYRSRRDVLVRLVSSLVPDVSVSGTGAGSFFVIAFDRSADCQAALAVPDPHGLSLVSMEHYQLSDAHREPSVVVGFGNLADDHAQDAVRLLGDAIARRREGDALLQAAVRPGATPA
jgi:GntR family transcriptional regulator / MocR family aminotransferase